MRQRSLLASALARLAVTSFLFLALVGGQGVCALEPVAGAHHASMTGGHGHVAVAGAHALAPVSSDGHCDPHDCCAVAAKKKSRSVAPMVALFATRGGDGDESVASRHRPARAGPEARLDFADPGGAPLRL